MSDDWDELDLDPSTFYLRDGKPMIVWHRVLETLLANDRPIAIVARICDSTHCLDVATHETWWPAPSSQIKCGRCTAKLQRVAETIGILLVVKQLEPPIGLLEDDSSRRFAMMELV